MNFINWNLIGNPVNWAIIVLMTLMSGLALTYLALPSED